MTRHLVIVLAMLGLGLPAMAHAQSARAQLEDAQAKVCRDRNAQRSPRRRARQPPGDYRRDRQRSANRCPAPAGRRSAVGSRFDTPFRDAGRAHRQLTVEHFRKNWQADLSIHRNRTGISSER